MVPVQAIHDPALAAIVGDMRALGVSVYRRGDTLVQLDPSWSPPRPPKDDKPARQPEAEDVRAGLEAARAKQQSRGLRGVRRPSRGGLK